MKNGNQFLDQPESSSRTNDRLLKANYAFRCTEESSEQRCGNWPGCDSVYLLSVVIVWMTRWWFASQQIKSLDASFTFVSTIVVRACASVVIVCH